MIFLSLCRLLSRLQLQLYRYRDNFIYISQYINNCKYIAGVQPRRFYFRGIYVAVHINVITFVCTTYYLFSSPLVFCVKLNLSPWWGGIFERMVRSVKSCLKKDTIRITRIAFEELQTVFRETELILNNRPLTFTYDIGDEFLTPSHVIHGRRLNKISILETIGIKNTCYSWEKVKINAIKATLFLCMNKKIIIILKKEY